MRHFTRPLVRFFHEASSEAFQIGIPDGSRFDEGPHVSLATLFLDDSLSMEGGAWRHLVAECYLMIMNF